MNLPLLGVVQVSPIPAGAGAPALLAATDPEGLKPVVEVLTQTRRSLTLRSLLLTGFPHDPEFFAAGLALAREWSRRGLKVAIVDLEYRHPTVVHPKPHPNEGYVDVLEYGCSFRRVAWELVADALWLVGPGSHPPEEERLANHPDADRAIRVLSNQTDVTLYLAPFLDRKGLTGRISKRMDGVLLVASVERAGRSALRDAFLELWGSDAPMIGCLGISTRPPLAAGAAAGAAARVAAAGAAASATAAPAPEPSWDREPGAGAGRARSDRELVGRLSEEVRTGSVPRVRRRRRSRVALLTGVAVTVAAAAGILAAAVKMHRVPGASAPSETLPAGTEEVLPARVGGSGPPVLPQAEPPVLPQAEPRGSAAVGGPLTAQDGDGPYRVYVASFRSEAEVRDMLKTLRARGLDAWYEPAANLQGWYRVFVGHYATLEDAAAKAEWLLDHRWVDRAIAYPDTAR